MEATNKDEAVRKVGKILQDSGRPMKERYRALFTLKNLGGRLAIEEICKGFRDESALLKHECAYCLGQMQDYHSIPYLTAVLKDSSQPPMVRHEAGEALGAIGSKDVLNLLEEYTKDPVIEVAETCQLAVKRIRWLHSAEKDRSKLSQNPYMSVDPAPPSSDNNVQDLRRDLLDESLPLFQRYRAMFSLRNKGDESSVLALTEGLKCSSALFRHEIAYVLGQLQHPSAVKSLSENLFDRTESSMVRHECAEALGAIATDECTSVLAKFKSDAEPVVKESCEVALDMCDYEKGSAFQYADSLIKLQDSQ